MLLGLWGSGQAWPSCPLIHRPAAGRVDLETENAVVDYAVECPAHGQVRFSNELRKRGVFVSPSGVRSIWLRHDLVHFKTRLKALEAKVAEEGIILETSPDLFKGRTNFHCWPKSHRPN